MKKRKILLLIPFAGLILSGCSAQDGFGWIGQNIFTPIKDFFSGLFNPGGKQEEQKKEEGGGEEKGGEEEVETVVGSIENPVSASEFCAKADELIDFSKIEVGKSETCKTTLFFVEGKVTSSKAMNQYGEIEFLNMVDTENNQVAIVGHFTVVDSSITEDYSEANSLQSKTVVVKGYACLFNHKDNGKTYQLAKKDNDNKPTVVKVTDGTPTPGVNYGTLENPLTTSEAWALIDNENPTNAEMYVGGTVVSNTAWSTQYNNIDIVITDGVKEFTIYRAGTLPSSYSKDNSEENDLLGYTLVAAGIGKIYTKGSTTTYELDQGCVVLSLEAPPAKQVASIVSTVGPEEVALNHVFTKSEVTVTVMFEGESEPGTAKVLSVSGETGTPGGPYTADVTIEGWNETLHFTYNVSSEAKNYGTAESPLSISEAFTLLDGENPTKATMFVGGVVKSNGAWSSQYSNVDVTISDGAHDFKFYRANSLPAGVEGSSITSNSLVGKTVVASGTGKIYNGTYELDTGCSILSIEDVEIVPTEVKITSGNEVGVGGVLNLTAEVGPFGAPQDVNWSIMEGGNYASLNNAALTGTNAGTVTIRATAVGHPDVYDEMDIEVSSTAAVALAAYTMNGGEASTTALTAAQVKANFFKDANCVGTNIVTAVGTANKLYPDEGPSLKFGSSSAKGELGLTLSQGITKITFRVKAYDNAQETCAVIVNGTEVAITKEYASYNVELSSASTSISIAAKNASKNRFYITNLDFYA